jgi:hypothetical protein
MRAAALPAKSGLDEWLWRATVPLVSHVVLLIAAEDA